MRQSAADTVTLFLKSEDHEVVRACALHLPKCRSTGMAFGLINAEGAALIDLSCALRVFRASALHN